MQAVQQGPEYAVKGCIWAAACGVQAWAFRQSFTLWEEATLVCCVHLSIFAGLSIMGILTVK